MDDERVDDDRDGTQAVERTEVKKKRVSGGMRLTQ